MISNSNKDNPIVEKKASSGRRNSHATPEVKLIKIENTFEKLALIQPSANGESYNNYINNVERKKFNSTKEVKHVVKIQEFQLGNNYNINNITNRMGGPVLSNSPVNNLYDSVNNLDSQSKLKNMNNDYFSLNSPIHKINILSNSMSAIPYQNSLPQVNVNKPKRIPKK